MILNLLMSHERRRRKLIPIGFIFLPMGGILLFIFISRIVSLPWGLGKIGLETMSIEGHFGPYFGATYTIEVDGKRYVCSSGRSKLPKSYPIPILYDPEDPSRCRDKEVVDLIGDYEGVATLGSLFFFLFGLSIVLWRVSHSWFQIAEDYENKKRLCRGVALAAEVIFYCSILPILFTLLFASLSAKDW